MRRFYRKTVDLFANISSQKPIFGLFQRRQRTAIMDHPLNEPIVVCCRKEFCENRWVEIGYLSSRKNVEWKMQSRPGPAIEFESPEWPIERCAIAKIVQFDGCVSGREGVLLQCWGEESVGEAWTTISDDEGLENFLFSFLYRFASRSALPARQPSTATWRLHRNGLTLRSKWIYCYGV